LLRFCGISELRAGQGIVLRPGEQSRDHDRLGHWLNDQQVEIEERVDVTPQQQPVDKCTGRSNDGLM